MERGSLFFGLLLIIVIITLILITFSDKKSINLSKHSFLNSPYTPDDRNYSEYKKSSHNSINTNKSVNLSKFSLPNFPCSTPCTQKVNKWYIKQFEPKTVAKPKSAPFVASFLLEEKHVFDGVIISTGVVLTARHNLTQDYESYLKDIKIAVGHHDNSLLDHSQVQIRKIRSYSIFDTEDLARVYLDRPFEFNDYVTEVALPDEDFCKPGKEIKSFSFGPSSESFMDSTAMHAVTLKIQTEKTCSSEYGPSKHYQLCANDQYKFNFENCTFFCQGDSGSPLIMVINGVATLVGLLLGGKAGCSQNSIKFVNVFYFKNWLLEKPNNLKYINRVMDIKVDQIARYAM